MSLLMIFILMVKIQCLNLNQTPLYVISEFTLALLLYLVLFKVFAATENVCHLFYAYADVKTPTIIEKTLKQI